MRSKLNRFLRYLEVERGYPLNTIETTIDTHITRHIRAALSIFTIFMAGGLAAQFIMRRMFD